MTSNVNICSVRVPSLPLCWRHREIIRIITMMLCRFGQLPKSSVFAHSAALLQAVLQANTELFWNGLVETSSRAIEMRNWLGTFLVPVQFPSQMKRNKLTCTFKSWFFILILLFYPLSFINIFQLWKIPLTFLNIQLFVVSALEWAL